MVKRTQCVKGKIPNLFAFYLPGWFHPYALINKDHQRMMVDPMFMIVQGLRSFLTAVTPTPVAPIAVILPVFT